ncbi:hypothetical protein OAU05_00570 [bacterium]|nr:hypothetical protein [bacterium]
MQEKTSAILEEKGYAVIKNFMPKELAAFLSNYLHVRKEIKISTGEKTTDPQIPDAACIFSHEPILESLYIDYTKKMEEITGCILFPTYIYARIYKNGNVLEPHKDRPSCEISATIKLNESEDYSWPIAIEGSYVELDVGDAVVYKGCEVLHWRDKCEATEDYFLSQMFMHFVDKNGQYADFKFDKDPTRAFILSKFL